jgi:hypothetical protein
MSTDHGDNMYSLIKYDLNYKELFSYKYDKELNNSEVVSIFFVKNKLFLFSFSFDKKKDLYQVFGTTLNKETGKLETPLKEIVSLNSDFDRQVQLTPNILLLPDSSGFVTSCYYKNGKDEMAQVMITNLNLNKITSASYNYASGDQIFSPVDFVLTDKNELIFLGMDYKIDFGLKKKNTDPFLKAFILKKFSTDGKPLFSNVIKIDNKYLIKAAIKKTETNELLLTGLVCNSRSLEEINGVILHRYDASNGKLISSSELALPAATINNTEAIKKVFGKEKTTDGLLNNLKTPGLFNNPITKSTIILTEFFAFKTTPFATSSGGSNDYSSNFTFLNGPLVFIDADQNFNLSKIYTLPKNQVQKTVLSGYFSDATLHGADAVSAGFAGQSLDFYSSAGILFHNNKMLILINDNPGNNLVTKIGDNAKVIDNLSISTTFVLVYDFTNGTTIRKPLFNNSGQPIPLLKNATLLGNDIYLFARLPHMLGKSDYRFIRISIK